MPKNADWLPSSRQDQLTMANNWLSILQSGTGQGNSATTADKWGVPPAVVTDFSALTGEAEMALKQAKNEETRTAVANARCKTAFDALIVKMRDVKKRYFFVPPLADADIVSLGLKPRDTNPTMSGTPTAQAEAEMFLAGDHQLGIKVVYTYGNPDDAANKSFRVWYSAVGQGETPPAGPGDLRDSFSTKRKRDLINFAYGDSGKTAYVAVQIENGDKKGPWGAMRSKIIP